MDTKATLRDNVLALMTERWGGENLTRLAREAKVGPGTASRIKAAETSVGVDVLEKVAALFDVPPSSLLMPGLGRTAAFANLDAVEAGLVTLFRRLDQASRDAVAREADRLASGDPALPTDALPWVRAFAQIADTRSRRSALERSLRALEGNAVPALRAPSNARAEPPTQGQAPAQEKLREQGRG